MGVHVVGGKWVGVRSEQPRVGSRVGRVEG